MEVCESAGSSCDTGTVLFRRKDPVRQDTRKTVSVIQPDVKRSIVWISGQVGLYQDRLIEYFFNRW
jgi:hypothetical protein